MHGTIGNLIASYGYLVLFLLVAIESFGVPLPGETALVTAAAYAALGHLNIVAVIATAAAGAIVGDSGGYWVGRKGGIALVRRYGRHFGLSEAKLERAHAFFERHGPKTVFIGRFVALLRSWAAALAGVGRMRFGTFMRYNGLGGIVWASIFGMLGYAFGHNVPLLERYVAQISLALVLLAALGVLAFLAAHWFTRNGDRLATWMTDRWRSVATSQRFATLRARYPGFWSFIASRFAREEYLGLHLTVGFLLSVAALWLFGGVTEDVVHHDPLTAVDLSFAAWMRVHSGPMGDRIAMVVTILGSPVALAIVAVVVGAILARKRWWIVLVGWIASSAGASLLNWALKRVVARPRPVGSQGFLYDSSFSFPSGHAMGSLVQYGMLAYLLIAFWPSGRRHRAFIAAGTAVLVLMIGLSRLYLGVHFLSDVIGGYAAGTVWLAACVTGVEIALRQRGLAPWEVGVDRRPTSRSTPAAGSRT